ncbi:MAG: hypothetical protein AAB900_02665 [Patescibacteria group bacterium]
MEEIISQIKNKNKWQILAGTFLILLGLILYLVPFIPSAWVIILGLEILGIRLLAQAKFKKHWSASKFFSKLWKFKD